MTCPSCLRALQVAAHRDYRKGCVGCGIRDLAHMGEEERERMLDKLCHLCGPAARDRVRRDVALELARIKKLRVERAKERT